MALFPYSPQCPPAWPCECFFLSVSKIKLPEHKNVPLLPAGPNSPRLRPPGRAPYWHAAAAFRPPQTTHSLITILFNGSKTFLKHPYSYILLSHLVLKMSTSFQSHYLPFMNVIMQMTEDWKMPSCIYKSQAYNSLYKLSWRQRYLF